MIGIDSGGTGAQRNPTKLVGHQKELLIAPDKMIAALLSGKENWRSKNTVLFEGFCAWVVAPKNNSLRISAMRIMARKLYAKNLEALAEYAGRSFPADYGGWRQEDSQRFKKGVPKELLGGREFLDCKNLKDHVLDLRNSENDLAKAHRLIEIWLNMDELKQTDKIAKDARPSLRIGAELAHLLYRTSTNHVSERTFERAWENSRRSIAFSYSAKLVCPKAGRSLLDEILAGKLPYQIGKTYLRDWFGYASYLHGSVLSKLPAPKSASHQYVGVTADSTIEPKKPVTPKLSHRQLDILTEHFR